MRIKAAVVFFVLTLASSTNITGQQEPLPRVTSRSTASDVTSTATSPLTGAVREEPTVYLPAIPLRDLSSSSDQPSLTVAAQNHDYATFHEQYLLAKSHGERVAQFDALHELWTWSMASPTGAFYGPELYSRIAAAYPNFPDYIDDYTIVDRNGNAFYPTAETRTFLLEQAMRNRTAPRVLIARDEPSSASPAPIIREINSAPMLTPARSRSRARMLKSDATPVTKSPARHLAPRPHAEPVQIATATPKPAITTPAPAPVVNAPVVNAPVAIAQQATAQPRPQATLAAMTTIPVKPLTKPLSQPVQRSGRAVLMIIIGLLGAGILAVLLRTPNEETITVMPQASSAGPVVDVANIEPIRKQEDAAPSPQQTHDHPHAKKSRRAHGSHR